MQGSLRFTFESIFILISRCEVALPTLVSLLRSSGGSGRGGGDFYPRRGPNSLPALRGVSSSERHRADVPDQLQRSEAVGHVDKGGSDHAQDAAVESRPALRQVEQRSHAV